MKKKSTNREEDLQIIEDLYHSGNWKKSDPRIWRRRIRRKRLMKSVAALILLVVLYLTAVFSNIPLIRELRTLYIETAMSTMTHQWLATYFIPKSVIDEVMDQVYASRETQEKLESVWDTEVETEIEEVIETETEEEFLTEEEKFYRLFPELDTESFHIYFAANPEIFDNGYDHVLLEYLSSNSYLYDISDNEVCVVDSENNVFISKLKSTDYVGKIAVVKDPAQVDLLKSDYLGSTGQTIETFAQNSGAVVAINASRFEDPGGHGMGGVVRGSLVIDGVEYGHPYDSSGWKFFGMKEDNHFYITNHKSADKSEYRWAIECIPSLVVNGENVVDGSFGMGIQPRSSIGQTEDGTFVFVIVDGRQVGYSLGCSIYECAQIMMRYGVVQGANLDGGSSSVMYYKGKQITRSSSVSQMGRYSPDSLIIRKASDVQ